MTAKTGQTDQKIKHNRIRCKLCKNIVESVHRHDFRWCPCGAVFVDGGKEYVRCGGKDLDLIEILTEYESGT